MRQHIYLTTPGSVKSNVTYKLLKFHEAFNNFPTSYCCNHTKTIPAEYPAGERELTVASRQQYSVENAMDINRWYLYHQLIQKLLILKDIYIIYFFYGSRNKIMVSIYSFNFSSFIFHHLLLLTIYLMLRHCPIRVNCTWVKLILPDLL